jgi:hypothetical protein
MILTFCALVVFIGCGTQDLVVGGMLPLATPTATATPGGCLQSGQICGLSGDCCSGQCVSPDGVTLQCL